MAVASGHENICMRDKEAREEGRICTDKPRMRQCKRVCGTRQKMTKRTKEKNEKVRSRRR